jgi:hypothetical protein
MDRGADVSLDYGLCDADITSIFNGYLNYELPFGRDRMFGEASFPLLALIGKNVPGFNERFRDEAR